MAPRESASIDYGIDFTRRLLALHHRMYGVQKSPFTCALSFHSADLAFPSADLSFHSADLSFHSATLSFHGADLSFRSVDLSFHGAVLSFRSVARNLPLRGA